jgi:hypothetical protein
VAAARKNIQQGDASVTVSATINRAPSQRLHPIGSLAPNS